MATPIRVISERVMKPGFEGFCKTLMTGVRNAVRRYPGLLSYETFQDARDCHKYVVLTQWKSEDHLDKWLNDPLYKDLCKQIDSVLDSEPNYRILLEPKADVFLLYLISHCLGPPSKSEKPPLRTRSFRMARHPHRKKTSTKGARLLIV